MKGGGTLLFEAACCCAKFPDCWISKIFCKCCWILCCCCWSACWMTWISLGVTWGLVGGCKDVKGGGGGSPGGKFGLEFDLSVEFCWEVSCRAATAASWLWNSPGAAELAPRAISCMDSWFNDTWPACRAARAAWMLPDTSELGLLAFSSLFSTLKGGGEELGSSWWVLDSKSSGDLRLSPNFLGSLLSWDSLKSLLSSASFGCLIWTGGDFRRRFASTTISSELSLECSRNCFSGSGSFSIRFSWSLMLSVSLWSSVSLSADARVPPPVEKIVKKSTIGQRIFFVCYGCWLSWNIFPAAQDDKQRMKSIKCELRKHYIVQQSVLCQKDMFPNFRQSIKS